MEHPRSLKLQTLHSASFKFVGWKFTDNCNCTAVSRVIMGLVIPVFGSFTYVSCMVLEQMFLIDMVVATVISDASVLDICL
jgi:hypothetical protein